MISESSDCCILGDFLMNFFFKLFLFVVVHSIWLYNDDNLGHTIVLINGPKWG